jgi:magnesium transporter
MSFFAVQELLNKSRSLALGADEDEALQACQEELETLLGTLSISEISEILSVLPLDDARLLWPCIPDERENDILWEVGDELREELEQVRDPGPGASQINAFELVGGRLRQVPVVTRRDLVSIRPIWIDMVNVSASKRLYLAEHFGLDLPDPGVSTDLEVSARFHVEDDDEVHLHSNFLLDREGSSRSVPVVFILHEGILFSLRDEELPVFRLQRLRARTRTDLVKDCYDLLLDLYGSDVEYSADSLEDIYKTLSRVSKQVLSETMTDQEAASVLANIAEEENLNGQIRSNILDSQRALAFLIQSKLLNHEQISDARLILQNIESLNSHTSFLFDKINFLMDATIGFININQNRRVNQLTVLGVVFMPINIVAGIGGMSEFTMMTTGIPWQVAYGTFIGCMALIGAGTYRLLKHLEYRKARPRNRRH